MSQISRCRPLAGTLACLLDGNKTAAEVIFYTVVSNKTRLDIIEALAKKLVPDGPEKDGVLKLLDRADRLNKSRNNIIHGEYHTGMNGLDRLSIRPLAKETRQWTPIGVSEITQHLQAVEKLELAFSFARRATRGIGSTGVHHQEDILDAGLVVVPGIEPRSARQQSSDTGLDHLRRHIIGL